MLAYMVIREAEPEDWPAVWLILNEVGAAGETLTWDAARTEARARVGWMRGLPGRTIIAVDDDGTVIGSANTLPIHPGPGAHVANAGFVVHPARREPRGDVDQYNFAALAAYAQHPAAVAMILVIIKIAPGRARGALAPPGC
jgi:hypothetical protein